MKKILFSALVIALSTSSCYYDKFEDFKPVSACDTASVVGFAAKVKPILDAQCTTCHGGASPSGNINLDSYASAKTVAQTGKLLSSIVWDGKASQMPKGAANKMDNCNIALIQTWITSNYAQ